MRKNTEQKTQKCKNCEGKGTVSPLSRAVGPCGMVGSAHYRAEEVNWVGLVAVLPSGGYYSLV